jgi:hypothetical protein
MVLVEIDTMKLYFLFALIDLMVLLVYPIVYVAYYVRKLMGSKH